MNLADFEFELPPELIAQAPPVLREASRLMVVERGRGAITVGGFPDLADNLAAGDLLVVNDTRVFPARLLGQKRSGGRVEILLVRPLAGEENAWLCMSRSSKPLRVGTRVEFAGELSAEVLSGGEGAYRHLRFDCRGDFFEALETFGRIPLPPYIRREDDPLDRERYQTVFARERGSVAAPTAGLHFTPAFLEKLRGQGVEIAPLTLHVGPGTFIPVRSERLEEHRMHREFYSIPEATAAAVNRAKTEGRRVIAVGTTTTRTLESAVDEKGRVRAGAGESELFILPGFSFRVIDGLVTNFHLPHSTLLMLVSAFGGRELILEAYRRAVRERFRFFSYGDCMFIA